MFWQIEANEPVHTNIETEVAAVAPERIGRHELIGYGGYGKVYKAIDLETSQECALKILKPSTKVKHFMREVEILRELRGQANIVKLLAVINPPGDSERGLVLELVNTVPYNEFVRQLTDADLRYYIYQLLKALEACHRNYIMHRDVKPENVLIDTQRRLLRLTDFGLAEYYVAGTSYSVNVSTRFYKSPELLLNYTTYDYAVDMWPVGCMLAALIFKKDIFFKSKGSKHQLGKIVGILGWKRLREYAKKYRIPLRDHIPTLWIRPSRVPWRRFVPWFGNTLAKSDAIDLVDNLLRYDQEERLTAAQALQHSYFDEIRKQFP